MWLNRHRLYQNVWPFFAHNYRPANRPTSILLTFLVLKFSRVFSPCECFPCVFFLLYRCFGITLNRIFFTFQPYKITQQFFATKLYTNCCFWFGGRTMLDEYESLSQNGICLPNLYIMFVIKTNTGLNLTTHHVTDKLKITGLSQRYRSLSLVIDVSLQLSTLN